MPSRRAMTPQPRPRPGGPSVLQAPLCLPFLCRPDCPGPRPHSVWPENTFSYLVRVPGPPQVISDHDLGFVELVAHQMGASGAFTGLFDHRFGRLSAHEHDVVADPAHKAPRFR